MSRWTLPLVAVTGILLGAFGMSGLPKGTPCYALIWEGEIGAFHESTRR